MTQLPEAPDVDRALPRLLVLASTLPARPGDGTPGFVDDLARAESSAFRTRVLAPMVPDGQAVEERDGVEVRRYRFFPRRWEDLADGAILENLRDRPSRWLQVPPFFVAGTLAVRRTMREVRPDVVHVHWIIPQGLMALAAAREVPWLVTTLGGDLYALTAGPLGWLKSMVVRRASAVTVMNAEMRDLVIGMGVPPERVEVLPMGVDLDRLEAAAGGGAEGGRVAGRLVFVGRLVEKKGLEVLLRALHELPADLDWSLEVVGDGPLRAALEAQARALAGRVTFSGQQSAAALAGTLRRAEVAVFPSVRARSGDQDGLPVAMLEAMAAGTAVVASDLPGLADAVRGEEPAGLLVQPGDPSALAAALRGVLADPGLRTRLGAAAARRVGEYSVESIGARYVDLLRAAVAGAGAGTARGPLAPTGNGGAPVKSRAAQLVDRVGRMGAHALLATRAWSDSVVAEIARSGRGRTVLEIGSGRQDLGQDAYSLRALFADTDDFVQSDVNPAFGHRIVDVTDMDIEEEFDLVLCMYVLEHVFDVRSAVENMRRALKPGGRLVIAVPHLYPYHDEPIDFWRFTEYSLKQLCAGFSQVEVRQKGARRFPKALLVVATR